MRNSEKAVLVSIVVVFVIIALGIFGKMTNDCEAKHGHLAKDAYTGIYKCYDKEIKR